MESEKNGSNVKKNLRIPKNWYVETERVVTLLQLKSIQSCIRIPDLLLNSKKTKKF